ncbi:HupE/UreJ family protein [Paenibacillus sp. LMG 31460]|uniref:HupE/UreJ family protein n=1 Tax=Paenibacillus germinis TaxID=2654979 RepID=A0ABX1Z189_9BACL|nr:HupE/UreJ family protein [Paenibacillus germinis]NOU86952.1 HupE/UreJ family protein [Paenibacillus germinis]
MNRRSLLYLIIIFLCLCLGTATTAFAHFVSTGLSSLNVKGNEILYDLYFDELDLMQNFDSNGDNKLENEELTSQKESLESYVQKGLRIDVDSKPLKMEILSMKVAKRSSTNAVVFQLRFTADEVIEQFNLHYNMVFDDAPAHTSTLIVRSGENLQNDIIDSAKRDILVNLPQPKTGAVLWKYFKLGIEHILIGYDHLLFLLSLVLIASRFKDALKIVTSFTIAHSITLFLVASGRIHVIPSWVEALIAATICYVAVENMFVQKAKWRWILTALFGLIHGMGFAGALAETGLPKGNLIGSLLMFNLGVETGQIIILCLLLPLLIWLRRFPWYRKMMISTSCLIFVLAFYWLIQRL